MAQRSASAVWSGKLTDGAGRVSAATGIFADKPVTWAARTGDPDGMTSPEELLAAAHASCYAMALSHALAESGSPAENVEVTATVGFGPKDGGGFEVKSSHLDVKGKVPGIDQATFTKLAAEGEAGCPISNALRNNITIDVDAKLI